MSVINGTDAADTLTAQPGDQVYAGAGDDTLSVNAAPGDALDVLLDGGAGANTFNVATYGAVTAYGGEGADVFNLASYGSLIAEGRGGGDTFNLALTGQYALISLGAGVDHINLLPGPAGAAAGDQPLLVSGFAAGAGGDVLAISAPLKTVLEGGADVDPFAAGFARLVQYGADTLLQVAATPQGAFSTAADFLNVQASSFTAENLASFTPALTMQPVPGTSGPDTLAGGAGDHAYDGGAGSDTLTYAGLSKDYALTVTGSAAGVVAKADEGGVDSFTSVETIRFQDGAVTFDPDSPAAEVDRLYALLGRSADASGLQSWQNALKAGATMSQIADGFLASPEWQAHTGGDLSNADFAADLYREVLHREPDAGGLANWTASLDAGASRADVAVGFSESAENRAAFASHLAAGLWEGDDNAQGIAALYDAALGRAVDPSGLQGNLASMAAGASFLAIANGLAGSAEFAARHGAQTDTAFVDDLYQTALHRPADPGGEASFVSQLAAGTSRAQVVLEIAQSQEHQALLFTHPSYAFLIG